MPSEIKEEPSTMRVTKDWLSRNWQPITPSDIPYRTHRLANYSFQSMEIGDGPPLVFVPGLAGGSRLHLPLISQLSQYFKVITFEFRGENLLFTRRMSTQLKVLAEDLAEFIFTGGWERPLVHGTSFGGVVSLLMAKRHPGLIQSLFLQGVGNRFQPGLLRYLAGQVLTRFPLAQANPFLRQVFTMLLGGANVPERLLGFAIKQIWTTDQAIIAQRFRSVARLELAKEIEGLAVPSLLLTGNRDIIVTKSSIAELAGSLSNCQLQTISGGGHLAGITHPAEIAQNCFEFAQALGCGV